MPAPGRQSAAPAWKMPAAAQVQIGSNPGMAFATACALLLVLVRFSSMHDLVTAVTGVNLRLLYIVTIPAVAGLLVTDSLRRVFQDRPAVYWTAFSFWIILCTPFSFWKGQSVSVLISYFRTNFVMMLVIAGLVVTWKDCNRLLDVLALSGIITLLFSRVFQRDFGGGRVGLEFGSLAGPDDMAAHLILLLPFVLRFMMGPKRNFVLRSAVFGILLLGLYRIVTTGARSAGLGLLAAFAFVLLRATLRVRLAFLFLAPTGLAAVLYFAPATALQRMQSYSKSDPEAVQEAIQSSELRKKLLLDSIRHTFTHPLFGVGPGVFSAYEFNYVEKKWHDAYHETHNTFTQISSECGLPGLFFFVAALVSAMRAAARADREARARPDCQDVATTLFCLRLGMIGFLVTITFLTFGYVYHLSAMVGVMVAVTRAARVELNTRSAAQPMPAAGYGAAPVAAVLSGPAARRGRLRAGLPDQAGRS